MDSAVREIIMENAVETRKYKFIDRGWYVK
jgi:hypothetical protein